MFPASLAEVVLANQSPGPIDVDKCFILGQPNIACGALHDAPIGLMRDEQVNVVNRKPGLLNGLL